MIDVNQSTQDQNPLRTAWRRSRSGLVAIALFSAFINLIRFASPIYALQILDRVIASRSLETLVMLTIIVIVAIMFGSLVVVIRRQMLMSWGNWIERFFGPALFTAGLKRSGKQPMKISALIRDVRTLRSFVSGEALIAWIDVVWAPLFALVVFLISPTLGYILAICCVIALILGAVNVYVTRESRDTSYMAGKDAQDWIDTAERHQETVGSLNIAGNFTKLWSSSAFTRLDENMRARLISVYLVTAIRMTGRFLRIAILGVGIWLVIQYELTIGAIIAANVLGRTAFSLIQKAMIKWRDLNTAGRAYERMKDALKKDTALHVSIPSSDQPVPLVLENATYRYPQQAKPTFRNINLTVNPGEALFVIGPSASGKTTFSRLVSGLLLPRSGSVRLGDVNVFRMQRDSVIREIGNLPQDTALFRGSVRENIAGMSAGNIDEVVRAAKMAGIHETILTLPEGYDTVIVEYEPLLSSGQRKAIALARAFYGKPSLVVLDEPIPHLDKSARSALFKAIKQLKAEGCIIIITTQSKVPSKYADKVILFEGGPKYQVLLSAEEIAALRSNSRVRRKRSRARTKNGVPTTDG